VSLKCQWNQSFIRRSTADSVRQIAEFRATDGPKSDLRIDGNRISIDRISVKGTSINDRFPDSLFSVFWRPTARRRPPWVMPAVPTARYDLPAEDHP
jgi:hypothetical protein